MSEYLIIAVCHGVYAKSQVHRDTFREYCSGTKVKEDDLMLLVVEDGGVTTTRWERGDRFPIHTFILESEQACSNFVRNWRPHPWWCKPKRFEFVKVEPLLELRKIGYTKV